MAPGAEPKATKPVCPNRKVPDGDLSIGPGGDKTGRMGGVPGSQGRLFSRPCASGVTKTSTILLRGTTLPVPGLSLRAQVGSSSLHPNCRPGGEVSPETGNPHPCLSGRLAYQSEKQSQTDSGYTGSAANPVNLGLSSQLGEVSAFSGSDHFLSGFLFGLNQRSSLSIDGQDKIPILHHKGDKIQEGGSGKTVHATPGDHGVLHRCDTRGTLADATPSASSAEALGPPPSILRGADPCVTTPDTNISLVDRGSQCAEGPTHYSGSPRDQSGNGCFPGGLGRSPGGGRDLRGLVRGGGQQSYQLAGVEGCAPVNSTLRARVERETSTPSDRQLYSNSLHQQGRRDTFPRPKPVSPETPPVVLGEGNFAQGQAHSGGPEHHPGRSIPKVQDLPHGMVPEQRSFPSDFSVVGNPQHRSLRHEPQQAAGGLCVPSSGPPGLGSGCPVSTLVGDVGICLPPDRPNSESSQKDPDRELSGNSNRPMVASPALVSRPARPASRDSSQVAPVARHNSSAPQSSTSQVSGGPEADCVQIIKQHWVERGVSEQVAQRAAQARRGSTNKSYNSRLRVFFEWCRKANLEPLHTTVNQVAEFLEHIFRDRQLQARSIQGYRAAISVIHPGWEGISVSKHKLLSDLIRSFFLARPPTRNLVPSWNLPLVLLKLCLPPFEPLDSADIKFLTWKTAFLLAAASGRRRSGLHALSVEEGHIRWDPQGVQLIPHPGFLAKNESVSYLSKAITLPNMASISSVHEDKWLCPCRALRYYIKRTKGERGSISQLFITYAKGDKRACSRDTISRWVVETIKWAYANSSAREQLRCHAHEVRSLSTSWAVAKGVSLNEVLEAANWKTESTFTAFYLRDVEGQKSRFAEAVLSSTRN